MKERRKFTISKHDPSLYEYGLEHELADLIESGWNVVYQPDTTSYKIIVVESPD